MDRRLLLVGGGVVFAGVAGLSASFLRTGSSEAYAAAMTALRAAPGEQAALKEMVRFATLAANGHNTQPWRFRLSL